VFCSNLLFDGVRVDFAKPLNENYSLHHSFQMGSQIVPSLYSFQAVYGDTNSILSGQMDSYGNLHGRTQNTWKSFVAKSQVSSYICACTHAGTHHILQVGENVDQKMIGKMRFLGGWTLN
jgi:hypothetical protein